MKSDAEIRAEARKTLFSRWTWRIAAVYGVILTIAIAAFTLLDLFFGEGRIQTWQDFQQSWLEARSSGLDLVVPSKDQCLAMTGGSAFMFFLKNIFGGILALGFATTLLNAVRDRRENWFAEAFGGFRQPFGMFWLTTLMIIRILLWSLLLVIPGVIAAFRYCVAWYVKSENPDWSAARCLAESSRLMKGFKWRYFSLTCSYAGWWLSALVIALPVGFASVFVPVLTPLFLSVFYFYCMGLFIYTGLGHAVFYEEMKAAKTVEG